MKSIALIPISLLLVLLSTTARAANFTCNSAAKCQAIAGYIPANSTTLKGIQSLFQVPTIALLGANGLPPTTPDSIPVPNGTTINVPFPCRCSNGTGVSDGTPYYTYRPSDTGLDAIARYTFDQFVTYQEIAKANPTAIKDVDKVPPGTRMLIPLPCSCDPVVDGEPAVHLGYVVPGGSTVSGIADEFGTTEDVLLRLNRIADPKLLQAGQVIDVPLRGCASNFSGAALDRGMLVANGSYAVTAEGCVQCTCSSSSNYQLSCKPIQGLSKSKCPVPKCAGGDLFIGNSTSDGCKRTTCAYQGYTNSTGLKILPGLVTESTCNEGAPSPQPAADSPPPPGANPPPSGNFGGRLRVEGLHIVPLLFLQLALFWFSL